MSQMDVNLSSPAVTNTLWYGTFSDDVEDFIDKAWVLITDFSQNKVGPCYWQSRDSSTLPRRGDLCVVTLNNRGNWWILAWWPISFE
jgi:hypothetical protein